MTGYADEGANRFLSLERFADSVSSVECSDSQIKIAFGDQGAFSAVQESWTWMNQDSHTVYFVLSAGECDNEKRVVYAANQVSFSAVGSPVAAGGYGNDDNEANANSGNGGTATIDVIKSNWEEAVP